MPNTRIKHRSTLADVFCDTYIEMDPDPRRGGYISIAAILNNKRYCDNPNLLFMPKARPMVFDRNGFPVHKIRTRFERALRQCGDNICRLRNLLNEVFTDDAIRVLFTMPNIWLLNNNYLARKRATTEMQERNRIRNLDKNGYRLHNEVISRVSNRSVGAETRFTRRLQTEK